MTVGGECPVCGECFTDDVKLAAHTRQEVADLDAYRERGRESRRRSSRKWRQENGGLEYEREYHRQWKKDNPERWSEMQRRWRARRRERETPEERTARLEKTREWNRRYRQGQLADRQPGTGGRQPTTSIAVEAFVEEQSRRRPCGECRSCPRPE